MTIGLITKVNFCSREIIMAFLKGDCAPDALDNQYSYEEIEVIANFLKKLVQIQPQVGIICGSGLGAVADILTEITALDYKDIPNFPISTVIGHAGRLIFGKIKGVSVVCMQGRFHYYEGNSLSKCCMPVRLMKLLGVTKLIVSNAAGSVNPSYKTGDLMLIKDHINLIGFSGNSPLRGFNDERWGPRFLAMNKAYDPTLLQKAKEVTTTLGLTGIQEGVYACVGGPIFESVAEVKLLRILGVDAVGMSTIPEIITARHCGIDCFAFSLITNECVAEYDTKDQPDSHQIVSEAEKRQEDLKKFVEKFVAVL